MCEALIVKVMKNMSGVGKRCRQGNSQSFKGACKQRLSLVAEDCHVQGRPFHKANQATV